MMSSKTSSIHKLGKGGESPFFYAFLLKGEQLGGTIMFTYSPVTI